VFLGLFISKTNDDFPYYHLPFTMILVENKIQFGLGNLNTAYNHISSLFFLNSTLYMPYIKHYSFNFTSGALGIYANGVLYEGSVDYTTSTNSYTLTNSPTESFIIQQQTFARASAA
jgi:hypothetical protein